MTKTFRDLHVDAALCDALEKKGITHPFAIQELTLPLALEGHDLIGQARTGTGKTLAFGLPLLQRIDPSRQVTQALVITPTRELASQVHDDLLIGSELGITSISVYGGTPYEEQIEALNSGVHVVVGTPGRLLDHLNRGNLDLSQVTQLVLDEADEMLDMGFLPDVERLIDACKGDDRHTMLFSATMPTAIVKLARRYMDHPTFTRADHEQKNTAPLVDQHFFQVHRMDKPRILARILQSPNRGGVYVFVRTKHMADRLVNDLEQLGTPAIPIHGDLRQTAREKNLDRFRSGKATVLVATEVAARGLDVTGVTHVVNYDCPDDEKMYLHRIGRTARAGEAGVAVTFAEFNEADRLNVIRKAVGATDTDVLQVFSTSPELTELFDLPDEKPWDAMVRETTNDGRGGASGSGRSDSSSGRARSDSSSGRARSDSSGGTGRSDSSSGRARSDSSGGTGRSDSSGGRARSDSSSGRARSDKRSKNPPGSDARRSPRRPAEASTPRSASSEDRASAAADSGPERPSRDRTERVRTRTRTRRTTQEAASTEQRGDDGATPPPRAGARKRARADSGRRPKEADAASGSSGGAQRDDASQGQPKADRADSAERGPGGGRKRSSGRSGRSGQRADDGGNGANGDRGSAGRDRGSAGRDRGRSDSARKRGRGSSDSRQTDTPANATLELQQRGTEARGEGQPQPSRRVKVEHLP